MSIVSHSTNNSKLSFASKMAPFVDEAQTYDSSENHITPITLDLTNIDER